MREHVPLDLAQELQAKTEALIAHNREIMGAQPLPPGADLDSSVMLGVLQSVFVHAQTAGKDTHYCAAMAAVLGGWVLAACEEPHIVLVAFVEKVLASLDAELSDESNIAH